MPSSESFEHAVGSSDAELPDVGQPRHAPCLGTEPALATPSHDEVDRARERALRQESVQAAMGEITSELDPARLLNLIVQRAAGLVDGTVGILFLWQPEDEVLVPRAWHGFPPEVADLRIRSGAGAAGMAVRDRRGTIVNAALTPSIPNVVRESSGSRWIIGQPVLYRGRLVGALAVGRVEDRTFDEADLDVLRLFADQVAISMENAEAHHAAVRRADELAALLRATRVVMSGLDLQETLARIAEEAAQIAGTEHVKILVMDRDAGVLRMGA
jgi:GAF domain-containing protein